MRKEYRIVIEGQNYSVVVSDEREALLAAEAAGKASVGLLNMGKEQDLSMTRYVIESESALTEEYLERVMRRKLGLPWQIAGTERLLIREFQMGDEEQIPKEPEDTEADRVFYTPELLKEYIRCQYGFYEYGIWAVEERHSGIIVGKAGVSQGNDETAGIELGYHIFTPYRRKGYAKEACKAIIKWCQEEIGVSVYAKIDASNEASVKLVHGLDFHLISRKCNESGRWYYLYERSCQ